MNEGNTERRIMPPADDPLPTSGHGLHRTVRLPASAMRPANTRHQAFASHEFSPTARRPPRGRLIAVHGPQPVGTIFKSLLDSLHIPTPAGCHCDALRIEMDRLGVAGCQRERTRLIAALKENAEKVSWIARVKAIGPAVVSGLAFQVDPLDPIPGLLDEALRRAAAREKPSSVGLLPIARPKRIGGWEEAWTPAVRSKEQAAPSRTRLEPICQRSADRQAEPSASLPPVTGPANLLWFVWPRRQARRVWTAQQDLLRQAIGRFDGRTLCAIAVDDAADPDGIDRSLWDDVCELRNDPRQRELPGWRWLMERIRTEPGITVWLHGKGVTRGAAEPHLQRWWELAYETLLDVSAVRRGLEQHAIAGVFRRNEPARNLGVAWHFSGTFYAFRNDWVFSRDWQPRGPVDPRGWYAEAWPALIAPRERAVCLRFDGCRDLYQARNWREVPCD